MFTYETFQSFWQLFIIDIKTVENCLKLSEGDLQVIQVAFYIFFFCLIKNIIIRVLMNFNPLKPPPTQQQEVTSI